jgi:hypothetical protein
MKTFATLLLTVGIISALTSMASANDEKLTGLDRAIERAGSHSQGRAPHVLAANRAKQAWEGEWHTLFIVSTTEWTSLLSLARDGNVVTGEYTYGPWYGYVDAVLSEDGYTLSGTWNDFWIIDGTPTAWALLS